MRGSHPAGLRARYLFCASAGFALLLAAQTCAAATTTTTIALSATTQSTGTALTLTAAVLSGATSVTRGAVAFCDATAANCIDSAVVGTAQLTSAGTAAIKIVPAIGSHTYKAVFSGTVSYSTSTSASSAMTVTGTLPTTTTITSSGAAGNYTLIGQIASVGSLTTAPTGGVSFSDASNAGYSLGSATLGAGSLAQTFPIASSTGGLSIPRISASADFNGDGIPDVVVADQSGNVTVLLGTGTGTFTAAPGSPITGGSQVVSVATGDFNNDGSVDIAAVDYGNGSVRLLLGNGDGTFQAAISATGYYSPSAIAVGDFNRDGFLDAALTSQDGGGVYILLGNGAGDFSYSAYYGTGSGPYSAITLDLNGDGFLDLVIGNAGASSVAVLLGNGDGTFSAAAGSPFSTGLGPWSIALADLNGDGKRDLIAANQGDQSISILAGNGDGTFGTFSSFILDWGRKTLTTGDFNGDGNQDVVVCNYNTSTVSILMGNGDLTFQPAQTASVGAGGCAGLVAADSNGDGLPDIEVALQGNNNSVVLLNTATQTASASLPSVSIPGNGSHNIAATYAGDTLDTTGTSSTIPLTASKSATTLALAAAPVSTSQYAQQVVLTATLNPYLVGAETTAGESITFYNNGVSVDTGTLSSGSASLNISSLPLGSNSLTAVYTADANFLGSTSSATSYTVSKATPAITWSAPAAIAYGTALSATQLNASSGGLAGTFVYTPASGTVLAAGAGQALSVAFTPTDATDYNSATGSTTITVTQATPTVSLAVSSASLTSGTALTLTATLSSSGTAVYPGTVLFCNASAVHCVDSAVIGQAQLTSGGMAAVKIIPGIGSHSYKAIVRGTTNYLTVTSSAAAVSVAGSYKTLTGLSSTGSAGSYALTANVTAIANLTASPTGSVAFKDTSNSSYLLGSASLGAASVVSSFSTTVTPLTLGNTSRLGVTADFNGDGIPDLAIPGHTAFINVMLGNGDGTFVAKASPIVLGGTQDFGLVAADLNNDGNVDLVAFSLAGNKILIMLGNGDGTFQTATAISINAPANTTAPVSIVAADFNSDGNLDLAVAQQSPNDVEILFGDGTGAFPTSHTFTVGSLPNFVVLADFNGDRNLDLAVANQGSNTVSILINDGAGNFSQPNAAIAVGSSPAQIYTADFNNDGSPDLLTSNNGASTLTVLLGVGNGTFTTSSLNVGAGTKLLAIADFDGDGNQDIAVGYHSAAQTGINAGNGDGTFKTQTFITPVATGCAGILTADFNGDGLPDLETAVTGSSEPILLNTTGQTAPAILSPVSVPGTGLHNIQAMYAGDANDATSTSTTIPLTASPVTTALTLSAAPASSTYGQSVTLTATLSPSTVGGLSNTGETITFKNAGATLGVGTLSAGVATLTLSSLPGGSDTLTAVYAGDMNFLTSTSSTASYTVSQASPSVLLGTSLTPSAYAVSITLTATLPSGSTGTVTFLDSGSSIGTGTISGTTATLAISSLAVGTHSLTASWPGNANYTAGLSAILSQVISRAAATVIAVSSLNPSQYGDLVTLSISISGAGATPTGTVLVQDGATTLATLTLSGGGLASLPTSLLAAGAHTLIATYQGDTHYY